MNRARPSSPLLRLLFREIYSTGSFVVPKIETRPNVGDYVIFRWSEKIEKKKEKITKSYETLKINKKEYRNIEKRKVEILNIGRYK